MKLTVKGRVYVHGRRWTEIVEGRSVSNVPDELEETLDALAIAMTALREIEGQCIATKDEALRMSVKGEAQNAIEEIEGG